MKRFDEFLFEKSIDHLLPGALRVNRKANSE